MRRVVLVTRPEPGLSETMRAVAALGYVPLAAPLLRIQPLRPAIPRRVQAVLLTSGQAVEPLAAAAPFLGDTPVLAVGDATARRARDAGFADVVSADGDAIRLAALATQLLDPAAGSLLLACGCGHGADLLAVLRQNGFCVSRRCLYRTAPASRIETDALDALAGGRVRSVLFFSAETARCFLRIMPGSLRATLGEVRAIGIGERTATALSRARWRSVSTADQPTAASMLDQLREEGS